MYNMNIKEEIKKINYLIFSIKNIIISIFLLVIFKTKPLIIIEIDNQIPLFEINIDYSNYSSDIKAIALFLPQFHAIKENDIWWGKGFTEWTNVRKAKALYKCHHQPRRPGDPLNYLGYYDLINSEVLMKQVHLAKTHGIYGFGIYYYWFSGKTLLEKPLNIFLLHKNINFHFLLIWANENWTRNWDGRNKDILIKQEYKENDPEQFIKDIKKYLIDKRYIKIDKRPVLGIYEPYKIINLNQTILTWRQKSREYGIGDIFIIITLNNYNLEEFQKMKLFNGAYQFSPRDSFDYQIKSKNYYLYTGTLYKEFNITNIKKDFYFFKGSMIEFDNSPRKKDCITFENYSPEQFYMLNKKVIEWTKKRYKNHRFIFINAWNEWGEGTYLEPDEKYGYASINALSKAIFNLPYKSQNYNYENLKVNCKIAVQAHIYYDDLINDIINKINNIPVKYDLFISTDTEIKKEIIEQNIKQFSKAYNYEISIFKNKGRDVLPFLIQMHNHIKNYKYICHIHSKKTKFINFGDEWRNYLYNNLLGSENIVSEILSDFEFKNQLGIIFPEPFYKVLLSYGTEITEKDKYYMNYLLKKINKSFRIGNKIEFPIGNMFWAKVKSIYQIFELDFKYEFPEENYQIDGTIMHGIERIWLYLVKLNGYNYMKIFKHF